MPWPQTNQQIEAAEERGETRFWLRCEHRVSLGVLIILLLGIWCCRVNHKAAQVGTPRRGVQGESQSGPLQKRAAWELQGRQDALQDNFINGFLLGALYQAQLTHAGAVETVTSLNAAMRSAWSNYAGNSPLTRLPEPEF